MTDIGVVYGSVEQAKEIIVGKDVVYVHTDITKIEDNNYSYHEIQYSKDEYFAIMAQSNSDLKAQVKSIEATNQELSQQIASLALKGLY